MDWSDHNARTKLFGTASTTLGWAVGAALVLAGLAGGAALIFAAADRPIDPVSARMIGSVLGAALLVHLGRWLMRRSTARVEAHLVAEHAALLGSEQPSELDELRREAASPTSWRRREALKHRREG